MPYQIRKSDGNILVSLPDGQIDNVSSSITFVGKNVSSFGEIQNNDFLHLLENFARNVEPANKLRGQIWYDTQNYSLKFYDGASWQSTAVVDYSATQPLSSHLGYLWYDISRKQLYINTGTVSVNYTLIGPETVAGYGETKLLSTTVTDINNVVRPVIQIKVDGETLGYVSKTTFAISSSTTYYRGITLNGMSNDIVFAGRSLYSNLATSSTNIAGGAAGSIPYNTATGKTQLLPIGDNGSVLYSNGIGPVWQPLSSVTAAFATAATNILGGDQGSIIYQTGTSQTASLQLGSAGFVMVAGTTQPLWVNPTSLGVGQANFASVANYGRTLLADGTSFDGDEYINASTGTYANTIVQRDSTGSIYVNMMYGIATQAEYADLAEKYMADAEYEVGTVVAVGGDAEVTACSYGDLAIGVVSSNPAYMMNSGLEGGTYIALKGRVPVKVIGAVRKGQRLIASNDGCAVAAVPHANDVFAVALASSTDTGVKFIEAVIL
jgi:hypothetical protein